MSNIYANLSKGPKRLIWLGYVIYILWINLFGGWDLIFDAYLKPITDSDVIDLGIMLVLYWLIVFLLLWVKDGFE